MRTPKLNLTNAHTQSEKIDRAYLPPISSLVWVEIALGIYALMTIILLEPYVGLGIIPWMTIYMLGYFYIAGLNIAQHVPRGNSKLTKSFTG